MFEFRIIAMPDGSQIIDRSLKTPYKALTRSRMLDYMEIEKQLSFIDWQKRKMAREKRKAKKICLQKLFGFRMGKNNTPTKQVCKNIFENSS